MNFAHYLPCKQFALMALIVAAIGAKPLFPLAADEPSKDHFQSKVQPVLQRYCVRCHNEKVHKSDYRVDRLTNDFRNSSIAESWHDLRDKINLGEMPPEDEPQPTAAELKLVVDWVTAELKKSSDANRSNQTVLRRLTRYEYDYTLKDLLGVDVDFAADLPPDSFSEDGFQNNGSALRISPLQMELFLETARTALAKVIVTGPKPEVFRHHFEKSDATKRKKESTSNELTSNNRFVGRMLEFPRSGEFIVRVKAHANIPKDAGYPHLRITMGMRSDVLTAESTLGSVDVSASADEPQVYEFRGRMEQFPLPGHNPKYPGVMITAWNDYSDGAYQKSKGKQKVDATPTIVIHAVDFEGPFFTSWPPKTHTQILFERDPRDDEPTYVRKVIDRFASRAYRRPATTQEVDLLFQFYNRVRPESPDLETAIRETLAMVLISPQFLYINEQVEATPARQRLSDVELASRLSYFLWSSLPDEELLKLAKANRLTQPEVLTRQVRRMLADPKSQRFVEHFTDQWLNLSAMDRIAVNPEYFPAFDDRLKADMRGETQSFFTEILRQDLSALNLLDADFTMLNRPLAEHYGLKGPKGAAFERTNITQSDKRGGLLTQGSILLGNSTGEHSHPIRRAVWVLERLLDSPPAPPPPDVPALDSSEPELANLSVKEQLEVHRQKQSCNDCHRNIDPWGVAFEHYDAVGNWRSEIVGKQRKGRSTRTQVVAKVSLPGGKEINGLEELKSHLLTHERERFSKALTVKLLTYGIGRTLSFADEDAVDSLTQQFAESDFRISKLIVAIVQSKPFQYR